MCCAKRKINDAGQTICVVCARPYNPRHPLQVRCGAVLCRRRMQYETARQRESYRKKNADRCRSWYQRNMAKQVAAVAERKADGSLRHMPSIAIVNSSAGAGVVGRRWLLSSERARERTTCARTGRRRCGEAPSETADSGTLCRRLQRVRCCLSLRSSAHTMDTSEPEHRKLHWGEVATQAEVAAELGISPSMVDYLERRAMAKLRDNPLARELFEGFARC